MSNAYANAGVDVQAGYKAVELMREHVKSTHIPGVLGDLGGFGGLFEPDFTGMKRPVLVSGTDGVGTKIKLAFALDKHDTVGIDCVAMCANDVLCAGAAPMFFLDYIACGKNNPEKIAALVSGVAQGCRESGCALIGGETAEMPGLYEPDEYDLAGFCVGLVDYDKRVDGHTIQAGDLLIGLPSSGVHSNGFSLIRKLFGDTRQALSVYSEELGCTLGQALLTPTRLYAKPVKALLSQVCVKGMAHITGGGFIENIPRMFAPSLMAAVELKSLPQLPVFSLLAAKGGLSRGEMFNTFNMGIGFVICVAPQDADAAMATLTAQGESPCVIGEIRTGSGLSLE